MIDLEKVGLWLCAAGAMIGGLACGAYALEVASATALVPGRPPVMLVTGVTLAIAGLGGAARFPKAGAEVLRMGSTLGGALVLLIGILTLGEYTFDVELAIDWAWHLGPWEGRHPGRPSPLTGAANVALGAALVLFDVRVKRVWPREWLVLAVAFIAFVSLVGHALGAGQFYRMGGDEVVAVALPTGISLLLTSCGILLLRPNEGVMALVTSRGPGGVLVRRLGLAALGAGPVFGGLLIWIVDFAGVGELPLVIAVAVAVATYLAMSASAITAVPLERAHEELGAARDRVVQLLAQAPVGVFVADLDGRYTEVNEAACRMLGYTRDELVGRHIVDLIAAEDFERLARSKEQQLGGVTDTGDWRLRRKDGSWLPAEVSARMLPDGRWQAIVRDISERQRMEGELQRKAAEQEFLARAGVELAACLEERAVIACVARLTVGFLGEACVIDILRGGVLERAAFRHSDPGKAPLVLELTRGIPPGSRNSPVFRVLETKRAVVSSDREEFLRVASSNAMRRRIEELDPASCMCLPVLARGQLLAVLTVVSCRADRHYDASDLRLANELARRAALALDNVRLYEQARLLGTVTTNLAEGVVVIRERDWAIAYTNPRFDSLFGYAPQELLGKPISIVNAPDELSPEAKAANIVAELQSRGEWHGEILNITKDGRRVWCEASVRTFHHEEHGTVWIALHTDITERKRLEEEKAQSLREKEALLREIHHRVKNNLQVISSLFSLQRSHTQNEDLRALLDESRGRLQAIALVHEHLYESTDLAAVDFSAYLRSLLGTIRATFGKDDISLDVSASDVILDADRAVPCALLVGELVSNAFKHAFADAKGTIRVSARQEQGMYVFEVEDDGRGLPQGFDFRESPTLGLRLVSIFVKRLRGTLDVQTNHGAHFVVRFPVETPAMSSVPPAEPVPSSGQRVEGELHAS